MALQRSQGANGVCLAKLEPEHPALALLPSGCLLFSPANSQVLKISRFQPEELGERSREPLSGPWQTKASNGSYWNRYRRHLQRKVCFYVVHGPQSVINLGTVSWELDPESWFLKLLEGFQPKAKVRRMMTKKVTTVGWWGWWCWWRTAHTYCLASTRCGPLQLWGWLYETGTLREECCREFVLQKGKLMHRGAQWFAQEHKVCDPHSVSILQSYPASQLGVHKYNLFLLFFKGQN